MNVSMHTRLGQSSCYGKQVGFTLVEALVAMAIMAVLATVMAPMAMEGLGSKKLTYQTQATLAEINRAFTNQIKASGMIIRGPGGTTATQIFTRMNYVRIDRTSTIQVLDSSDVNATTDSDCSATFPCLVLQDGGYLQYGASAVFPQVGANQLSAIIVNYDPDGSGVQPATTLVLYSQGRITSAAWADLDKTMINVPNTPTYAPFGAVNSDPEYLWGFTFENG